MFRRSVEFSRCIIPMSGFFEWSALKDKYYFTSMESKILMAAGIFRKDDDGTRFVMLTTAANESMEQIHSRMPLLLEENQIAAWMGTYQEAQSLLGFTPLNLKKEIQGQLSLFS